MKGVDIKNLACEHDFISGLAAVPIHERTNAMFAQLLPLPNNLPLLPSKSGRACEEKHW
jgi:hypothetical protein